MLNIRPVPWINQEELKTTYTWLFSDRKQQRDLVQLGLDRIQTWSNRGKVPFSVEITGMLIETIIRDEQFGQTMSHKELRLLYSMALVRFVNGLVDQEQKGKYAKTVLSVAKSINLPPWYVDLRHESTHERLPNLIVLRSAASQAVAWLHENYWVYRMNSSSDDSKKESNQAIKTMLNTYKERRKAYIKSTLSEKEQDPTTYVDCIETMISSVDEEIIKNEVIPLLLGLGGLVPVSKKKRATSENMSLSKELIKIWTPLLEGLSIGYPTFASNLVSSMVRKLCSTDEYVLNQQAINPYALFTKKEEDPTQSITYMLTLTCWLRYFVSELDKPVADHTLSNLHIDDVLEGCLKNPNYYTRTILQSICQIDSEVAESIKPFTRYIDQLLIKSSVSKRKEPDSLETLDDETLEKELDQLQIRLQDVKSNQQSAKRQKRNIPLITSWKLHENWQPCPIGMLPGGTMPCLDIRELLKK